MHHPTDRIIHTTAFVTPVMEHWLEREIAQWVYHEGPIRRPIAPWANALTTELHLAPPWRIDPTTHRTMSERSYHGATSRSTMKDRSTTHRTMSERSYHGATSRSTMKDRSDDPSHHERTLLPQSYISLHHEGSIRRPIAPWANALTTELHKPHQVCIRDPWWAFWLRCHGYRPLSLHPGEKLSAHLWKQKQSLLTIIQQYTQQVLFNG